MRGTASYLLEFLEGSRKRFIIPVYQRNYDWKRENCKQLFDDLVSTNHIRIRGTGTLIHKLMAQKCHSATKETLR